MTDDKTVSTIVAFNSLPSYIDSEYETKAYEYSLEYEAEVHEYSETKAHEYPLEYRTEAYEYSLELPQALQGPPPPPLPLQASNQHSQYFQATQPPPPPPQKVVQPTHNNSLLMSAPPTYSPSNVYPPSTTPSNTDGYQFQRFQPQQQFSGPDRNQSSQYPQKFVENQSIYAYPPSPSTTTTTIFCSLPSQPPALGSSSAPPAYPPSNVYPQQQSIYNSSLPPQPPALGSSSSPPAYPPSNVYPPSTTPSNDDYQFQQFQQQQQQFSDPNRNQISQYPQKFVENQSFYSSSLPIQPAQGPLSAPPAYPPSNVYPPSTTPSYGYQFQQFEQQQFQQFSDPNRKQSSQYPPVLPTNAYPPLFRMPQHHHQANSNVYPPPNYSNKYSSNFSNVYPPHPSSPSNFYPPNSTLSRPPQFFDSNRIQSPVSSQYLPVSSSTNAYPSPLPPPFLRSRLPETSQLTKSSRYRYQMENADNNRTEGQYIN
ncbi:hypothetical protein C1646_665046 [Rhizophagus diaphanus]|nr:hypothetical protein C1646_665046 [Rhizophagus diaphanus] [Rhizophagus sp. MUCL 43196]